MLVVSWSCMSKTMTGLVYKSTFCIIILISGNSAKVIGFGHLGDGNLHLNISTPQYDDAVISFSIP